MSSPTTKLLWRGCATCWPTGRKRAGGGGPASWPGPNCVAALSSGELLRGIWFDRGAEYKARQRGESVLATQFATTYDVKLTPLPCLRHLTESQRQTEIRRMVREIEAEADANNKAKGRKPMGAAAILAQIHIPARRPPTAARHRSSTHRTRRPRWNSGPSTVLFVGFRAGAWRLKARAAEFADLFPLWSFPPALPFNAPA